MTNPAPGWYYYGENKVITAQPLSHEQFGPHAELYL